MKDFSFVSFLIGWFGMGLLWFLTVLSKQIFSHIAEKKESKKPSLKEELRKEYDKILEEQYQKRVEEYDKKYNAYFNTLKEVEEHLAKSIREAIQKHPEQDFVKVISHMPMADSLLLPCCLDKYDHFDIQRPTVNEYTHILLHDFISKDLGFSKEYYPIQNIENIETRAIFKDAKHPEEGKYYEITIRNWKR